MIRGSGAVVAAMSLILSGTAHGAASPRPSFDDLLANLKSPNAKTREDAASSLGKSRRREAVTPLAALVRDPEPKVRLEVVKALRELRDLDGVPALVTSLGDGDPKIRREAIEALVEMYAESPSTTPVENFLDIFSDEYDRASIPPYTAVDPSVYQGLAAALKDEEREIREKSALALGILDGRSVVKDLVAAVSDPEPGVRGAAATALGKVGTAEEGKALIPLLADESEGVRKRVLKALGVLEVKEAGPALRQMYEANRRKDFGLRVLACLSRVGDPGQGDLFRELIQDPDPERKRLAVEGLGRISDASMLGAFTKDYQRERNEELKLAYSFSLTLLGNRAFLDSLVLCLPSKTLGSRCRGYILEMGPEILPELYPYLNDPEADVRAELCDILAALGNAEAIPRLEPLVDDPSSKVADRANRAVERLKRSTVTGATRP
ncbi:MAG: HEAT repeat domain-containing protein [Acidobacteria bacterium]|nr:HEAT repeat domain-containing protein [Acidobacteriota bacterium]